jgi:glycosyltransferase involved in cell wall biosynthesis
MSVSVVIPIYAKSDKNITDTLKCIDLAKKNTKVPFELILVETCSDYFTDEGDIHIYERQRTTATKSINRGFKICSGDRVILLTNDTFVGESWIECLLDCFDKFDDCGLATLATNQLGHFKHDEISEGIWFSVAMMEKRDALFDENFVNSWDDTDLIMRVYESERKMYRNYNCIAQHDPGQTHYDDPEHNANFMNNYNLFMNKHEHSADTRIFKILTGGVVV